MGFLFGTAPALVSADDALPGRATPVIDPRPHAVLGTPITGPWKDGQKSLIVGCLLYTSPSPRDGLLSRMPSSA